MVHWIEATAQHNKRPVRINADAIAYVVRELVDGPTHIHFIGSNFQGGKPDLMVLESPEEIVKRTERPR